MGDSEGKIDKELREYVDCIGQKENTVKLKNVLIVTKDIEKSKKYYHDLFGLTIKCVIFVHFYT